MESQWKELKILELACRSLAPDSRSSWDELIEAFREQVGKNGSGKLGQRKCEQDSSCSTYPVQSMNSYRSVRSSRSFPVAISECSDLLEVICCSLALCFLFQDSSKLPSNSTLLFMRSRKWNVLNSPLPSNVTEAKAVRVQFSKSSSTIHNDQDIFYAFALWSLVIMSFMRCSDFLSHTT